jgi:CDP-paratose 2-epimerase
MAIALITGSAGLIGSEAVAFFSGKGFEVIGVDNDMRSHFFGPAASTAKVRDRLQEQIPAYKHINGDIRDYVSMGEIFKKYSSDIKIVIHTAAQPSHDLSAQDPHLDFSVNAVGTLNLLELTRLHCPSAVFIFTSTNKVYGDLANDLPLIEKETRWELDNSHRYYQFGIDESMSLDQSTHSLFGVSKASADLLVQEYGRYFGMRTACFRGGCLTGPQHSGAQLHGFTSYLMKCTVANLPYQVFGYQGKQVRDIIHSHDLISMFWCFYENPKTGAVYNAGGGRHSNCSMLEAIQLCEELSNQKLAWTYSNDNRKGDHIWWISDTRKFETDYPDWKPKYTLRDTFIELRDRFEDFAGGKIDV